MMTRKIIILIKVIATIITACYLFYCIFIAEDKDYRRISQLAILFIAFIYGFFKPKRVPAQFNRKKYEESYKIFLDGCFVEDKSSYQKLIKCVDYYNSNEFKKAHTLLNSLEQKCVRSKDFVAVYAFHGLCYSDEEKHEQAIDAYNKVLQYDMAISIIWSNLGLSHIHMCNLQEAYDSLNNAIMYDINNTFAYINMAHFFLSIAIPQKALPYALKALETNPTSLDAIGWVAMTYKMLRDEEKTKTYRNLYIQNGGKKADITKMLKSV